MLTRSRSIPLPFRRKDSTWRSLINSTLAKKNSKEFHAQVMVCSTVVGRKTKRKSRRTRSGTTQGESAIWGWRRGDEWMPVGLGFCVIQHRAKYKGVCGLAQ